MLLFRRNFPARSESHLVHHFVDFLLGFGDSGHTVTHVPLSVAQLGLHVLLSSQSLDSIEQFKIVIHARESLAEDHPHVVWKVVNVHLRVHCGLELVLVEVDEVVLLSQDFVEPPVQLTVALSCKEFAGRILARGESVFMDRFNRCASDCRSRLLVDLSLHDLVDRQMYGLSSLR